MVLENQNYSMTDNMFKATLIILGVMAFCLFPWASFAASCTDDTPLRSYSASTGGIVTAVLQIIVSLLEESSKNMFENIVRDAEFQGARNAAIMIAVSIFGIMIIFDMVSLKPGEILGLAFKLALVVTLTSPDGWSFFFEWIATFFYGTMTELINIFIGVPLGTVTDFKPGVASLSQPLQVMNWPVAALFSVNFFIMLIGTLFSGPYGIILVIFLLWGTFNLVMALFSALFTYIQSIVGLWFLFALAPIFFICLLFHRTRNLFEGWINMVFSFTLRPVLLFAFFAFFITIVTASMGGLFETNWCWAKMEAAAIGIPMDVNMWRADSINGKSVKDALWGIYGGVTNNGESVVATAPLDIMDVLFFLLSTYIAWQYSMFVPTIANELSSGGLRLNASAEGMRNYFSARGMTPEQIATRGIGGMFKLGR